MFKLCALKFILTLYPACTLAIEVNCECTFMKQFIILCADEVLHCAINKSEMILSLVGNTGRQLAAANNDSLFP